jgi:enoyl-CoA hydratase/carnithine racemase
MTLAPPFVKAHLNERVLRLTLSRPDQRNPLSIGMLGALNTEIAAASADPGIAVIVIAAEGPVFSAGHDLKELTAARTAPDGGEAFFRETFAACEKLMLAISTGPKPVIAEVQGMATAAGCQLAAACDILIAAEKATFATPGVNIGLFCSTPAVPLVRAVGSKRARMMLLTGEPISAQEALQAGLVSEILPSDNLTARVNAVSLAIARKPQSVVALGKATLVAQETSPLTEAYANASEAMVTNLLWPEARDGIASFIGRKNPKQL